jgi:hypothetical protein
MDGSIPNRAMTSKAGSIFHGYAHPAGHSCIYRANDYDLSYFVGHKLYTL